MTQGSASSSEGFCPEFSGTTTGARSIGKGCGFRIWGLGDRGAGLVLELEMLTFVRWSYPHPAFSASR